MPTFSPTIAFVAISHGLSGRSHANAPLGWTRRSVSWVGAAGSLHRGRPTQTSITSGRERLPVFPALVQGDGELVQKFSGEESRGPNPRREALATPGVDHDR